MLGDIKDLIINPICLNITLKYYSIMFLRWVIATRQKGRGVVQNTGSYRCLPKHHRFHMVLRWINTSEELSQQRQANDQISHVLRSRIIFSRGPEIPVFQRSRSPWSWPLLPEERDASSRFLWQLMLISSISSLGRGGCSSL